MENRKILEVASKYRVDSDRPTGVVLIWDGSVHGWKDKLRDACHERPGAIAVDSDAHICQAQGGDDYNGAKQWVAI